MHDTPLYLAYILKKKIVNNILALIALAIYSS